MSTQYRIAHRNDIAPGEMKSCPIDDDRSVLLVNAEGELHAYTPECSHHGAPLADGLLFERRILCPWHLAQFDAQTGGLLQPPSMDGLPEVATFHRLRQRGIDEELFDVISGSEALSGEQRRRATQNFSHRKAGLIEG